MRRAPALAFATALAVLAGPACGEEDGGGGGGAEADKKAQDAAKQKAADKKKKDAEKKKKSKKIEAISFVPTLEMIVPADEAKTIRRRLKERDFAYDGSGAENRDPFRSYVLPQLQTESVVTGGSTLGAGGASVAPTEICTKSKLIATNYAMRDLALIGIVVRGAQRFALFRDAKGVGHMVERGKCLGREKALVTEIGDGHVTVEIVPEPIPNAPPPVPEKRSIPLYANELTVEDLDEVDEPATDTVPAPPPVVPGTAP